MERTSAIFGIPGHLLAPFRWAAQTVATIVQLQPNLLQHLFAIDRPRMHVIGLGLAHVPDHLAHQLASILFTAPIREAVHAVLGRCPAGILGVLHRLPLAVLSRDGYRALIDLLDEPASAKLLYHFKDKEIAEWMITVLHDAPLTLRPGLTAVVPHLALLDNVSAALRWFAARGAAPTFDALVADLTTHRQPAQLVARLNNLIAELPLPDALPPKLIGNASRIDSPIEVSRIGSQFKNCIDRYVSQINDGTSTIYVWNEPGLKAVCHVGRHGRLGWAVDRPLGPRNTDLNDDDAARVTTAFGAAGIPDVAFVDTIQAIAYLKFSRSHRLLWRAERERQEATEIWVDPPAPTN
jgi:hypothetical protein